MTRQINKKIDFILGLPGFNFLKNMTIRKTISQETTLKFYCNQKKCVINNDNRFHTSVSDVRRIIFDAKASKKTALLIDTKSGRIYGKVMIEKQEKPEEAYFKYTALYAPERRINFYEKVGDKYDKKNWFSFFNVDKNGGITTPINKPNMFKVPLNKKATSFLRKIKKIRMVKVKNYQKQKDALAVPNLDEFYVRLKSKTLIHEAELQHELLNYFVKKLWDDIEKDKLDVLGEFPQYKRGKSNSDPIRTKKRFDVVISDIFGEPFAYFELKLYRKENPITALIDGICKDYKKISDDRYFRKNRYFKIIILSYKDNLANSLKAKLPQRLMEHISIVTYQEPKKDDPVDKYVRSAAVLKKEE